MSGLKKTEISQQNYSSFEYFLTDNYLFCCRPEWLIIMSDKSFVMSRNRPFPSSLVPLFQSESKCETFHMKLSSARSFFFMQIKSIFIRMVSHLDSPWNRGTRDLGNGLLALKRVNLLRRQHKQISMSEKSGYRRQWSFTSLSIKQVKKRTKTVSTQRQVWCKKY